MNPDKVNKIETYLNRYYLEPNVPFGNLIGVFLHLSSEKVNYKIFIKGFARLIIPISSKKKVFKAKASSDNNRAPKLFISLASSNYRLFEFVKSLWESNSFNSYLTVPNPDFDRAGLSVFKKSLFPWSKLLKVINSIRKAPGIGWREKLIIFNCLHLQVKQ
jgi:hypothetical protein